MGWGRVLKSKQKMQISTLESCHLLCIFKNLLAINNVPCVCYSLYTVHWLKFVNMFLKVVLKLSKFMIGISLYTIQCCYHMTMSP
jgi:hypothetical protein